MKNMITCYHATFSKNIDSIIANNYKVSKDENLWLGNGIYFFYEDIYAFKWVISMNKSKNKLNSKESIIANIGILKNTIEYDESRIFDLTCIYEQMLFDEMYINFIKKSKINKDKLLSSENLQGIIINYMFKKLDLYKKYDIVKQFFRLDRNNYYNVLPNSIRGIPQYQLCIKNPKIIKNREVYKYDDKFDDYLINWKRLFNSKNLEELYEIENLENNNYYIKHDIVSYKVGD